MTEQNAAAMLEGDAVKVRDYTPMIARLLKEIRIEEERRGILLTVDEARAIFEDVKDQLIELIWKYAPEAAPTICREAPEFIGGEA